MKDTETNHYSTWEPLASLQYKGKQQRIQRYNLGRMSWKEELRSQVRRVRSGKFHTEWSNQDISWLNDKCEGFKKSFRHSGKQRPVSLVRGRSQVGFKLLHGNSSAQRPWSRDHDPQRKTRGPRLLHQVAYADTRKWCSEMNGFKKEKTHELHLKQKQTKLFNK